MIIKFNKVLLVSALFFIASELMAKNIDSELVKYTWNDQTFHGFLAKPHSIKKKIPGILIVHEWWGHNEYARKRAEMLAKEGYIALALDMYGDGSTAQHPSEAGKMSAKVSGDLELMQKRFEAGMKILQSQAMVEADQIAALGYCFGGGVVLQMARLRLPLKGVISYHGSIGTDQPVQGTAAMPKILVFHGTDDPLVSQAVVKKFKEEMNQAQADYNIVEFEGVKHAFTNPKADEYAKKFNLPLAYDATADKLSWKQSLDFLKKLFQEKKHKPIKAKLIQKHNLDKNDSKIEETADKNSGEHSSEPIKPDQP